MPDNSPDSVEEHEDSSPIAKAMEISYDSQAILLELMRLRKKQCERIRQIDHRLDMVMSMVGISILINLLNLVI